MVGQQARIGLEDFRIFRVLEMVLHFAARLALQLAHQRMKNAQDVEEIARQTGHFPLRETQRRALPVMEPSLNADDLAQPGNGRIRGGPEEVHAYAEQDSIQHTRDNDPFP